MKGILIPQTIFVGDTAQFLFPLSEQEVYRLNHNGIIQDTPISLHAHVENEAMTIKEIRFIVKDTRSYLMITFVPWETGTIYFPSLSFLQLQRELPAVTVASLLDSTTTIALEPPKPPPLIPGTDYTLYTAAGIFFLITFLFTTGIFFIYRIVRKRNAYYHAKKRMRLLKKTAKKLQKRLQKTKKKLHASQTFTNHIEIALWYTEVDRMLRSYLLLLFKDSLSQLLPREKDVQLLFFSYTYAELINEINTVFMGYPNIVEVFTALYTVLEKNRFGYRIDESTHTHIECIERLISKILSLAETIEPLVRAFRTQKQGHAYV